MSVYKVVSNYYNAFLGILSTEDMEHKGLSKFFADITPDKKKMIVSNLADMMVRFDVAFGGEAQYWKSTAKTQTFYMIINILILIMAFGVVIFVCALQIKEMKDGKSIDKIKLFLVYLIVFQIVLCIITIILTNISGTKKLCNGQIALLKEDFKSFSNYIFKGAQRDNLAKFFTFLGYWRRNSVLQTKSLYKELKQDSSMVNLVALFQPASPGLPVMPTPGKGVGIGKEVEVYDMLRDDIVSALTMFYNKGQGYIDVKKMVTLSSPIMMMKESKRIMNYYKHLGLRVVSEETNAAKNDQKDKEVIVEVIINPLNDLLKSYGSSSYTVTPSELNNAVILNDQNEVYRQSMTDLLKGFAYMAMFVYPIYVRTSETSPTFPLPDLIPNLPQNIVLDGKIGDEKKFLTGIKLAFTQVYTVDYQVQMERAMEETNDLAPILNDIFLRFLPLFNNLYFRVFASLEGNVWFPFDNKFITQKIVAALRSSPLPEDYVLKLTDAMYASIVSNVSATFDIVAVKRSQLVESLSTTLLPFSNIDVFKYQNYIINTLIDSNDAAKQYADELIELLNQVYKAVNMKRALDINSGRVTDEFKFKDIMDFNDTIGQISFREMKDNLEASYYLDIVDKFYANISESVNLQRPNMRNIYYQRQRSNKVWKIAVTMIIVLLVFILLWFILGVVSEKPTKESNMYDRRAPADTTDTQKALYHMHEEKQNNIMVNWYIKMILPVFVLVFLIAILISYQKKMKDTFDFNLEIIENNTSELKSILADFDRKITEIDQKLDDVERNKTIELEPKITDSDKKDLYEYITKIIDRFDKYNYIMEGSDHKVPFPYTEVIINSFMILVSVAIIIYIAMELNPITRISEIKSVNKLKEQVATTLDIKSFNAKIDTMFDCHNDKMKAMTMMLKIIFTALIVVFLLFYSTKIISTANDFKYGLYNSTYFDQSRPYN